MAEKQHQHRDQLLEERARLNSEFAQLEAEVSGGQERRDGSPFGKREEEATESAELEKRLALEGRIRAQLTEVNRALEKVDEGSYGTCDRCQLPIGKERLEALPWANLCLKCKAETAGDVNNQLAGL